MPKNFIKLDGDALKFDRNELNKQVFYPVIKAGYDLAKSAASSHRKTGQLLSNVKTISLAKKSKNQVGYVLMAGRRSDYADASPHFVVYYAYKNGRIYKQIKRKIAKAVKGLNN